MTSGTICPPGMPGVTVRRRFVLMSVAVLAAGCALPAQPRVTVDVLPAAVTAPSATDAAEVAELRDRDLLQDVLDTASQAFLTGDVDLLEPVLAEPAGAFGQAWRDRVEHMQALPLDSYRLRVGESLPDLATERVRARYDDPVQVVHVVEELVLDGFDPSPAVAHLYLTMVDTDDGWRLAGLRDAEALGLVSAMNLWDLGPVVATRDGDVLALHGPDGPDIGVLVSETRSALQDAADRWPLEWPRRAVVIVPRDEDQLATMLNVTFDLSNFVAFATATTVRSGTSWELTGSRVVLNPQRFLGRASDSRQRILTHELIHVASRPSAGPVVPNWLEEGVAQVWGDQRSATGTALLANLPVAQWELPRDNQFTTGGTQRIHLSYQTAWSFLDHLVARFGADRVGAFYLAAGQGNVGEPGTRSYLVDRAAREVFDQSLEELVQAWRASR